MTLFEVNFAHFRYCLFVVCTPKQHNHNVHCAVCLSAIF